MGPTVGLLAKKQSRAGGWEGWGGKEAGRKTGKEDRKEDRAEGRKEDRAEDRADGVF